MIQLNCYLGELCSIFDEFHRMIGSNNDHKHQLHGFFQRAIYFSESAFRLGLFRPSTARIADGYRYMVPTQYQKIPLCLASHLNCPAATHINELRGLHNYTHDTPPYPKNSTPGI